MLPARPALLLLALTCTACSADPIVQVQTRVGGRFDAEATGAVQQASLADLSTALRPWAQQVAQVVRTESSIPAPEGREVVVADSEAHAIAPTAPADLSLPTTLLRLREGPHEELAAHARRLANLAFTDWSEVEALLLAKRDASKHDYEKVLAVIGGDTPNRYGTFIRRAKRSRDPSLVISQDWFEDLLAIAPSRISSALRPVYRDCVLQVALLRAASTMAADSIAAANMIVPTLLEVAFAHDGLFRDETSRALERIGEHAVPTLIEASQLANEHRLDPYSRKVQRARFARQRLDEMDRLHPAKAVEAVRDDAHALAAVVSAYGRAKVAEAADVLASLVDHDTAVVRDAARQALLAYTRGPAPEPVRRGIRLIGGQQKQATAFLTYRQRAEAALHELLITRAPELERELCASRCPAPDVVATRLFAWLDDARLRAIDAVVDEVVRGEDRRAAMAQLDTLVASAPDRPGLARLTGFYWEDAQQAVDAGELTLAGQRLRKTARLMMNAQPELARRIEARALLVEAHSPGVTPAGRHMLLAAAHDTAPEDGLVTLALASEPPLAASRASVATRVGWWTMSAWLLALAALAAVWLLRQTVAGSFRRGSDVAAE